MHTCQSCHEPVTPQFTRVFGDNEGRVFSCPHCTEPAGGGQKERERGQLA